MVISYLSRALSLLAMLRSRPLRRMERNEVDLFASSGDPVSAGGGELEKGQMIHDGNDDEVARIGQ